MSISHRQPNSRRLPTLKVLPSGIQTHTFHLSDAPETEKTRGSIQGFSIKSRGRLRKMLMCVDFDTIDAGGKRAKKAKGWFVTLTYPDRYAADWREWKRHLDMFSKRLHRRDGFTWALWRLERQKRGAPHFHIVVVFDRLVDRSGFRAWLMDAWHSCVGTNDAAHFWVGTDARPLYNPGQRRLMSYLLKYLSKQDDGSGVWAAGRMWGVWGEMPERALYRMEFLEMQSWIEFVRRVRRYGKYSRYLSKLTYGRGFDLVGRGLDLIQLLRGLRVTISPYEMEQENEYL